ncbi:MAG: zinc ribbon domain-containing protein [Lachnospiraceae bacterium]|nr:zinc ribbon domain-containing protein [Lachnospiraceae bacterium]
MKENKIIKCDDCGRELIVGARFCKYCGTKVEKQAENDTMVCANCGKIVKKGLFCIQCGHKAEAEISAENGTISDNAINRMQSDENLINTSPLLDRAFIALADEEWDAAYNFCEQVLNNEPQCADAYLVQLLSVLKCGSRSDLLGLEKPFDDLLSYRKAIRFADEATKNELIGYNNAIRKRIEKEAAEEERRLADEKNEMVYSEACGLLIDNETALKKAQQLFISLGTYKDSSKKADECINRLEVLRKDTIYTDACRDLINGTTDSVQYAIKSFESIIDWKDSAAKINECKNKLARIEELQMESEQAEYELENSFKKKKIIKYSLIAVGVIFILLPVLFLVIPALSRSKEKNTDEGQYINASNNRNEESNIFTGDKEQIYKDAYKNYAKGNLEEAKNLFESISGYEDSDELSKKITNEIIYKTAKTDFENQFYDNAYEGFNQIRGYEDTEYYISQLESIFLDEVYFDACQFIENEQYSEAAKIFEKLGDYRDSKNMLEICRYEDDYQSAIGMIKLGQLEKAANILKKMESYKDSCLYTFCYENNLNVYFENGYPVISFGKYPQWDYDGYYPDDPIEWYVLDVETDNSDLAKSSARLLSKRILDVFPYLDYVEEYGYYPIDDVEYPWGYYPYDDYMDEWLNRSFIYHCFKPDNCVPIMSMGCLSADEVKNLPKDILYAEATSYALFNGVRGYGDKYAWNLYASDKHHSDSALGEVVFFNDEIWYADEYGKVKRYFNSDVYVGVRPTLTLELSAICDFRFRLNPGYGQPYVEFPGGEEDVRNLDGELFEGFELVDTQTVDGRIWYQYEIKYDGIKYKVYSCLDYMSFLAAPFDSEIDAELEAEINAALGGNY